MGIYGKKCTVSFEVLGSRRNQSAFSIRPFVIGLVELPRGGVCPLRRLKQNIHPLPQIVRQSLHSENRLTRTMPKLTPLYPFQNSFESPRLLVFIGFGMTPMKLNKLLNHSNMYRKKEQPVILGIVGSCCVRVSIIVDKHDVQDEFSTFHNQILPSLLVFSSLLAS